MKNAFALSLVVFLVACGDRAQRLETRTDVMFRVVAPESCGYCKVVTYQPEGAQATQIRLGNAVVRPGDIDYILYFGPEDTSIRFEFRPEAHKRIYDASLKTNGDSLALVVGDKVVTVFRNASPFSDGAVLDMHSATGEIVELIAKRDVQ
jgi:hypothetical protein